MKKTISIKFTHGCEIAVKKEVIHMVTQSIDRTTFHFNKGYTPWKGKTFTTDETTTSTANSNIRKICGISITKI